MRQSLGFAGSSKMSADKPKLTGRRNGRRTNGPSRVGIGDLSAKISSFGEGYRIHTPAAGNPALLEGHVLTLTGHGGLRVHATDAVALDDIRTEISRRPALTISLVLEGLLSCTLDGEPFVLTAHGGAAGMVWNTTRPVTLIRSGDGLLRVRKVNISLPPEWFETAGGPDRAGMVACEAFRMRHLAKADWEPSARAIRNAEDILRRHDDAGALRDLALEIAALEIVHEALSSLDLPGAEEDDAAELLPRDAVRARAAREFIDRELGSGRGATLRLAAIARGAGMSASTLNRVFKQCHGETAMDYLRRRRLELARQSLVNEGVSVAEAAAMAGYGQATNFATAYQREFGYPPSRSRREGARKRDDAAAP